MCKLWEWTALHSYEAHIAIMQLVDILASVKYGA